MTDLVPVTDKILTLSRYATVQAKEIEFFKTCKRTMGELLNPDFDKNCQFFISMCLMMLTV